MKRTRASSSLTLDIGARCLVRDGEPLALSPKDFALLRYLVAHRGRLISHADLLAAVWHDVNVSPEVLKVRIGRLRRLLNDDSGGPRFIENVHGEGYRFIGQVAVRQPLPVDGQELEGNDSGAAVTPTKPFPPEQPSAGSVVVGRDVEQTALEQLVRLAAAGERRIVLISGEAGIGKTTLIELFLSKLESDRATDGAQDGTQCSDASTIPRAWVGRGQCIEQYGRGEPFLPLMEAVQRLARQGAGAFKTALRRYAPTWLLHLPALASPEERETLRQQQANQPTGDRVLRELADALEALTGPAAGQAPPLVILVLEDLQWADPSTIDFLALLARRRDRARLLVLGSYRSGEVYRSDEPLRALLQETGVHEALTELALAPLAESDVSRYLDARFPSGRFPGDFAQRLWQRSDGNPLLFTNIARDLVESQVIAWTERGWRFQGSTDAVSATIPSSIRQLVARQRERLPIEDQRILEAASVAGPEFFSTDVAAALAWDAMDVEERCLRLTERQQFLRVEGAVEWPDGTEATKFRFLHAVYCELWQERVSSRRRQRWQLRIGESKEAAYADRTPEISSALAEHFAQGRDYRRAVAYHEQASRQAVQRGARTEARAHLDRAFLLLPRLSDTPDRLRQELRLQLGLGALLSMTEGYAAGGTAGAYYRARNICTEIGDAPEVFQAIFGLSRFFWMKGELDVARALGEQLIRIADDGTDPVLSMAAHTALAQVLMVRGELISTTRHAEEALRLARLHWDDALLIEFVYGHLGILSAGPAATAWHLLGYPDRALRYFDELLEFARRSAHPFAVGLAYFGAAIFHHIRRETAHVRKSAGEIARVAATHELVEFVPFVDLFEGWAQAMEDRAHEGAHRTRRAAETLRNIGAGVFEPYAFCLAAECSAKAGRFDEALGMLAYAHTTAGRNGPDWHDAEIHRLEGELRLEGAGLESGHPLPAHAAAEAEACFWRAIEMARTQCSRVLELRGAVSLATLWRRQGKEDEARSLVAAIYDGFTEGFDTSDLTRARMFLQPQNPIPHPKA